MRASASHVMLSGSHVSAGFGTSRLRQRLGVCTLRDYYLDYRTYLQAVAIAKALTKSADQLIHAPDDRALRERVECGDCRCV